MCGGGGGGGGACRGRMTSWCVNQAVARFCENNDFVFTQVQGLTQLGNWLCSKLAVDNVVVERTLQTRVLDISLFNGELIVSGCHEKQTSSTA